LKEKPVQDSADQLAVRQGEIIAKIMEGIQRGTGLTDLEWLQLYAVKRRLADRGFISERTGRTLQFFNEYRLYVKPRRLYQLVKRLETDFDAAQRIYTNKGLLQRSQVEEVRYESTLSGESPALDELPDWVLDDDESGYGSGDV
jgi:hypothetical protein